MKLWTRNPLAGVTLLGALAVIVSAVWSLVDQTALTPETQAVAQALGVLLAALGPSLIPLARRSTDE